jgi:predicted SAM-dependent methyltransferase/tetratricopeptide (TPR) repeat protein
MRLNLGCGKRYKEGFINIDAFDATVADTIMSVEDLAFPSNTVDAIEACQLIEHLGYIHTIYALAEWFRVLKPGGTILIETPDIELSMKHYLRGDHEAKKETLTWMYGIESPGMEHRLCFPKILLRNLLEKSGFTGITTSRFTMEKYHPVMRISCKKPQDYAVFQIVAQCRKKLVKQHLVHFDNSPLALEQEKLLNFFLGKLQEYVEKNDEKILEEIMIDGCIQSVPMTQVFLQECLSQKRVPKQTAKKYSELLQFLSSVHFTGLLLSVLKETSPVAGTQKKTIDTVTQFGKQSIKKIISDGKKPEVVKKALVTLSKKYPHDENAFFSETLLEYKAADLCYQAIKDFIAKDFTNTSTKLQEAIRLDRNHLLYYWNLGRVLMLTKKFSEAKQCYRDALTLVRLAPAHQKEQLETTLKKERDQFSPKKHGTPVLDVGL